MSKTRCPQSTKWQSFQALRLKPYLICRCCYGADFRHPGQENAKETTLFNKLQTRHLHTITQEQAVITYNEAFVCANDVSENESVIRTRITSADQIGARSALCFDPTDAVPIERGLNTALETWQDRMQAMANSEDKQGLVIHLRDLAICKDSQARRNSLYVYLYLKLNDLQHGAGMA